MKVFQIIPEFGFGGAEIMCEALSMELHRLGHEVCVISLYSTQTIITQRLEKAGIRVLYLNKKNGFDVGIIVSLLKLFKRERPDVVHTHLYALKYAVPACMLSGVKARIHTVHNIAQKEATPKNRVINKVFYKYYHVIPVALSNEIKRTIVEEYKLEPKLIPIIFNGIDLTSCMRKKSYELKGQRISILHVGRFSEQKNHKGLVNAFLKAHQQNPNCELLLVGDGELREEIQQQVNAAQLDKVVHLLGLQNNVYSYMQQADIFVLPSHYEGVPITLIEAMGTGLPIIATKVGGVPDMLTNEQNAILIDDNEQEICDSLLRLMNDQELRKRIGENALARADAFSISSTAKEYIQVYRKALQRSQHE